MKIFAKVVGATFAAGLATFGLAYNPISTYHYLADPGAAADDEYFYIITDSDDPAAYNADGYNIKALYGFRSKDMQNWTDFGIIYDARQVEGIGDIWASGIAVKDGKFYIVFPDGGGGGIGYIKADNIAGPWSNAVGGGKNKLVAGWGNGLIDCDGVSWCFDPGIFIDDDGTTYVTWGGGEGDSRPNTDNFDVVKLNDAKDGISGSAQHVKVSGLSTRKMLEASYIHKHGTNYYFSYSTGWQQGAPTIDYAMGTSPMGPFTWKGTILPDPNIDGKSINGNNNHHGIAEFKGHSYVVYHDRRIANGYDGLEIIPADDGHANPDPGFHRSVSVDEMFYNSDGTIKQVVCTKDGPEQIENFDPYDWYPALTSSKQKGIRSRSNFVPGKVAESYLLPLSSKESWIRVSGVDFGTAATGFTVEAASTASDDKIEIHKGSASGALAGTCTLKNTGSKTTFVENKCDVDGLSGIVDQLFLVFKGSKDSTMAIKAWGFEGSGSTEPTPQKPFGDKAWEIPGKIEMEDFDVPGVGKGSDIKSFYDDDAENHSCTDEGKEAECSDYRDGTGVDIYKKAGNKLVVGYIKNTEWLEYTVNVAETGSYTMYAAVASDGGSSFKLSIDGKDITDTIKVPANKKGEDDAQNFNDYTKISESVNLTKGEHVLRFTATADWFDIDYINFETGDGEDRFPIGYTTAIGSQVRLNVSASRSFQVYDMKGQKMATIDAQNLSAAISKWKDSAKLQGIYMVRGVKGEKSMVRVVR